MKKTDLEKNKALKIMGQMRQAPLPGRFGAAAGAVLDRREQRKIDQAQGLVPFAVKLNGDLVKQLQAQAEQEGISLNDLVDRVLRSGLAGSA
ncbi:MAG: toxin-antitoxin system HicB family antitoxin [Burkholderiales bacterium]|nr:toxin-antitoxin system HicB family antitoxin [Burkholderiales bacterium]